MNELSQYAVPIVAGILGWCINIVKNMATKRLVDLERLHVDNYKAILGLDKRIAKVETTFVTQCDLRELLDILREDINNDVNKSFNRLHERMDEVATRASNCTKYQAIISPALAVKKGDN